MERAKRMAMMAAAVALIIGFSPVASKSKQRKFGLKKTLRDLNDD